MTEEEIEYERAFSDICKEMRRMRARCSQVCSCYNSEDKDCEIFGSQRMPPSRCGFFLDKETSRKFWEGQLGFI